MAISNAGRVRLAVLGASTALVSSTALALAPPAWADKIGRCSTGTARYDLDVDKGAGRFEINFEADSNVRGQRWRMTLRHDGKRVFRDMRRTDREGEAAFERNRPNTAGKDAFRAKAVNVRTGEVCSARIVRR